MAQPARNIDNLPPEILATCMAQASGGDYDRLCVIGNASPAFRRGFELVRALPPYTVLQRSFLFHQIHNSAPGALRLSILARVRTTFAFFQVLGALKAVSLRITTTPVPAWPRTRNGVALPEPPQPVYEVIKCSVQLASNCLQTLKSVTVSPTCGPGPSIALSHSHSAKQQR